MNNKTKNWREGLRVLKALINVYKDQQDNLVNKIWSWHKQILSKQIKKAKQEGKVEILEEQLKDVESLIKRGIPNETQEGIVEALKGDIQTRLDKLKPKSKTLKKEK